MSAPRTFRLSSTAIILIAVVVALVFLVPSFARPQAASAQVCGTGTILVNGICTVNGYNNCVTGFTGNCSSGCGVYVFGYNCGSNCNGVNGYVAGCSTYSNCSTGSFYSYSSLGCGGSNCTQGYSVACTNNCGYVTSYVNQYCGNNNLNCAGGYTLPQGGCSNNTACASGYTYQNGVQVCSNTSACPGGYTTTTSGQVCSSATFGSCQGLVLQTGQSCTNGVVSCGNGQTAPAGTTNCSASGVTCSADGLLPLAEACSSNQVQCASGATVAQGVPCTATNTSATNSTGTGCAGITLQTGQSCSNGVITCPNGTQVAASQPCVSASTTSTLSSTSSSGAVSATYVAGWNLVAAPGGTTIGGATGPMYTFQSVDTSYETVQNGATVKSGQGYWAYFTSQMVDPVPLTTAGTIMIPIAAGSAVMIGNSGSTTATLSGADSYVVYDPVSSTYPQVTTLKPGQGGWAFSKGGGQVTITNQSS